MIINAWKILGKYYLCIGTNVPCDVYDWSCYLNDKCLLTKEVEYIHDEEETLRVIKEEEFKIIRDFH